MPLLCFLFQDHPRYINQNEANNTTALAISLLRVANTATIDKTQTITETQITILFGIA